MRLRILRLAALLLFASSNASAANPCLTAADNAQDLRAAGKLREARAELLVCSQRTCNAVVRADCSRWLKEVDDQTPSLVVHAVDARGREITGVKITIDDKPAEAGSSVTVDPGQHVLRAQARSGDVIEQKALVALGEKGRSVELRFDKPLETDGTRPPEVEKPVERPVEKRPPPDKPSRAVPIALAGLGVVALGAFTYFEIVGQDTYRDLENGCAKLPGKCTPEETSPAREQFLGAAISLGVAGVAFAAAAIVYFAQKSPSASALRGNALVF